jgi:hypothetical protein
MVVEREHGAFCGCSCEVHGNKEPLAGGWEVRYEQYGIITTP